MTNIRKVANQAGVSIGTVSRVLNNKPGVSAATRKRVRAVANALGYNLPQRIANADRPVTHIGVLTRPMIKDLPADPFYGEIFHGIETVCQQSRVCISYGKLEPNSQQPDLNLPMLSDERINGIILMGGLPYQTVAAIQEQSQKALILVDNDYPNCPWDTVLIDNFAGGYAATKHLIENGHTTIAMIAGTKHPSIAERKAGYQKALAEHGLKAHIFCAEALNSASGAAATQNILEQNPEISAIFCSNDMQAIGALAHLNEQKRRIPEDMAVIGFDNIATGQYTTPPLSTIHVDRINMGRLAAQLLFGRLQNPDRSVVRLVVGTALIERKTVSVNILKPQ